MDKVLLRNGILNCKAETDSRSFRTIIETLLKIHRNILNNEEDVQYRSLKTSNAAFRNKIWGIYSSRNVLYTCGWINIDNECLIFNNDERLLDIIDILLEFRMVKPEEGEWIGHTKTEGDDRAQLHEKWLKYKAEEEKKKDLEQFQKDKKYREELARNVKAEHEADKRRNKMFHHGVGNNPRKG